jgi:hypothetical protein
MRRTTNLYEFNHLRPISQDFFVASFARMVRIKKAYVVYSKVKGKFNLNPLASLTRSTFHMSRNICRVLSVNYFSSNCSS